jgi:hypothetical protein
VTTSRVLFLFLDGVGIGPSDPDRNPFLRADLPTFQSLLGGEIPTVRRPAVSTDGAWAGPADALLGVEGIPQSGTGQTALLTGENAPALFGRHFGPWVPVRMRPLLVEKNILRQASAAGHSAAFANAYPSQFHQLAWSRRPAGPPLAAHAAGLLTRDESDLAAGTAISSEIVNTAWRSRLGLQNVPEVSPEEAGRNLARIVRSAGLTFFAHYATDTAGHERKMEPAVQALERVDRFLAGVLEDLPPDCYIVASSDHGNLEDITQGHTKNPVLTLLVGPGAASRFSMLSRITEVGDLILDLLSG